MSAFLTALAAAWIQGGDFPGWPAVGTAAVLGLGAAVTVWRIPNAPSLPADAPVSSPFLGLVEPPTAAEQLIPRKVPDGR